MHVKIEGLDRNILVPYFRKIAIKRQLETVLKLRNYSNRQKVNVVGPSRHLYPLVGC